MENRLETYFAQNRAKHLEELQAYLRIPSVSALREHRKDIDAAAHWTAEALEKAGMEHVRVISTEGHPVVYGDWLHAPGRPTALVYGHYDVQPVDPVGAWTAPPFEPDIRNGCIYARGAADDKGQLFMHVKAAEACLKSYGRLPVNLKFCIEGEEEIGSEHLPGFVERNAELLRCDVVVISDSPLPARDQPAVCYGLRGFCGFQIEVRTAESDLHSGLYGGGVANAVHVLTDILGSLHDRNGRIAVEGFYRGVPDLTEEESRQLSAFEPAEPDLKRDAGAYVLHGEPGFRFIERTTARPALDVVGISGGYDGEGIKSIIPASARAKVSFRLVGDQRPDEMLGLIEAHIRRVAPRGVRLAIEPEVGGNPYLASLDHPLIQAAARAYERGFGIPAGFIRGGGSIPIVEAFHRLLKAPVALMGFGLPDDHLHAPDEHFDLGQFDRGLRTICAYWDELSRLLS